ncbi:MAG: OmpA family protein [Bacteroidetes bacterium]|nr:OmpA family protein [Bacteroidota bacterium]MBP7399453.1 OmpA family protein [Chitinophagales bacterium]MBK7107947.1 OmpA family protein [Bacteroidota bacterium]MBK8486620.1 OmpA family protein [Bacteroidota bacterium]MBK8683401.1 OmpA family protein [Bacteroidota bacterium]
MNKQIFFTAAIAAILISCVPARQYQDTLTAKDKAETEVKSLNTRIDDLDAEVKSLKDYVKEQSDTIRRRTNDLEDLQNRYDNMVRTNSQLRETEDLLNNRINQLLAISASENVKLSEDITAKEKLLSDKEMALQQKEFQLEAERRSIDSLQASIVTKENRIQELETAINSLNEKLSSVMGSLEKALAGFNSSDLTIEQRGGRIYINISEKLLFASGSTTIDANGKKALKQVADALREQKDVRIMVEGHTDNVPLKSANYPKDNWDLSVLRATTIVKILTTEYGVDAKMLQAAGSGEFQPVASNSDASGRSLNRRTEIVIMPDLTVIADILNKMADQ